MISNIQTVNTSPSSLYQAMITNKNINVDSVPKEVDDIVMNKNKQQTRKNVIKFGVIASIISVAVIEGLIQKAKKQPHMYESFLKDKVQSYRRMQFLVPIGFAAISALAYFETQLKKKIGIIPKEDIYRSQGFDVDPKSKNDKLKITKTEYAIMGVGAALPIINAVSKGKINIPVMKSYFNNKVLNTISEAVLNGVAASGLYTIGKAILKKDNN